MPEIVFKGKEYVYNHHLSVPYRPLVTDAAKGVGPADLSGNLIVHGDNLHALKEALLYRGADAPNYAAGTLQSAFTVGLITDADVWMNLRDARTEVSHAYDQDKAIALASMVKGQGVQAIADLLRVLQHEAARA
jgi:hypothetical protein